MQCLHLQIQHLQTRDQKPVVWQCRLWHGQAFCNRHSPQSGETLKSTSTTSTLCVFIICIFHFCLRSQRPKNSNTKREQKRTESVKQNLMTVSEGKWRPREARALPTLHKISNTFKTLSIILENINLNWENINIIWEDNTLISEIMNLIWENINQYGDHTMATSINSFHLLVRREAKSYSCSPRPLGPYLTHNT